MAVLDGWICVDLIKFENFSRIAFQTNSVPHTRPETPRSVTHNHDEDCSDEESDPKVEEEE